MKGNTVQDTFTTNSKFIEIAIVTGSEYYYDDNTKLIVSSITDWDKVTQEEYEHIIKYLYTLSQNEYPKKYTIIVREPLQEVKQGLEKTIKKIKKQEEEYRIREEKRKAEALAKKKEKELKKLALSVQQEKALFEKLKEKFEAEKR